MAYTTVNDPSEYFDTLIWTGNGNSPRTETGLNFQPDWVWHKNRVDSGRSHYSHDSSRGFGAQKELTPNSTDIENSDNHLTENHGFINAATSSGITIGAGASTQNYTNRAGATYVAWCWKANGATTTTNDASSTSIGSIDSVHQANTAAGFSIVTYTGDGNNNASFAHGLGTAPQWVLIKNRDTVRSWLVGHHKIGFNFIAGHLNSAVDRDEDSVYFNNTAPTSTVVTLGTNEGGNEDGDKFVAYCFAEVQGYSKFGTYTGNGNANGPFVYTGFKPAFIMQKNTADSTNWNMYDNVRSTQNTTDDVLLANGNDVEGAVSGKSIDFLSNGFKLRGTDNETNDNNDVHVYMAFAASPFVTSNKTPNNAS